EKGPHENADKLSVCNVDVGEEILQIVCGAPNVDKGQKVVVAKIGAIMPSGLEIKPTKLRGVPSNGMICSKKELGLPQPSEEKGTHENADKLSVCNVDVGEEILQIVCGAPNVDKGQKVVVAKIGAIMPSGLEIKPTKLRGVPSNGMICSKKELGLPQPSEEKG